MTLDEYRNAVTLAAEAHLRVTEPSADALPDDPQVLHINRRTAQERYWDRIIVSWLVPYRAHEVDEGAPALPENRAMNARIGAVMGILYPDRADRVHMTKLYESEAKKTASALKDEILKLAALID